MSYTNAHQTQRCHTSLTINQGTLLYYINYCHISRLYLYGYIQAIYNNIVVTCFRTSYDTSVQDG